MNWNLYEFFSLIDDGAESLGVAMKKTRRLFLLQAIKGLNLRGSAEEPVASIKVNCLITVKFYD